MLRVRGELFFDIQHQSYERDQGYSDQGNCCDVALIVRYIHTADQGKRGAIVVVSKYRERHLRTDGRKLVTKEKRQTIQPAASR